MALYRQRAEVYFAMAAPVPVGTHGTLLAELLITTAAVRCHNMS